MNEMIRMHLNLILSFTVSKQWLNKNGIRLIVWLSLLLLRWKCLKIANRPSQLQVWNLSSKTLQLGNQPQWSCRDSVRSAPRFKLNSTLNNICSLNPKIHGCNIIPRTIALANCPPKYPNTQYFVPYLDPYTCKGLARIAAESRSDDLKWSDFGCTNKRINKGPTKATQHLSVNSARFAHKFSKKLNPWNHQRMRPASLQSLSPWETSCQEAKGLRASGMSEATAQQHHEASSSCTARWRVHPRDLCNWMQLINWKILEMHKWSTNDQQMINLFQVFDHFNVFQCSNAKELDPGLQSKTHEIYIYVYVYL